MLYCGFDADDLQDQGVARLRALHIDGTGLRVDAGPDRCHRLGEGVVDALHLPLRGILGPEPDAVTRLDFQNRGPTAEEVVELRWSGRIFPFLGENGSNRT